MYNSQCIADRIKTMAKIKKITVGKMLSDCELNKNSLSTMQSGGYLPRTETLAKIADYLDCSVDYLLGRTDVPETNHATVLPFSKEASYKIAAYGADGTEDAQPPIKEKTT